MTNLPAFNTIYKRKELVNYNTNAPLILELFFKRKAGLHGH